MLTRELFNYKVALANSEGKASEVEMSCYWSPFKPDVLDMVAECVAAMANAMARATKQDRRYAPVGPASHVPAE